MKEIMVHLTSKVPETVAETIRETARKNGVPVTVFTRMIFEQAAKEILSGAWKVTGPSLVESGTEVAQ